MVEKNCECCSNAIRKKKQLNVQFDDFEMRRKGKASILKCKIKNGILKWQLTTRVIKKKKKT